MIAIATLRKHFGLSQSQLAQLLDVSTGYIKMAETGNRTLSLVALQKFLDLVALAKTIPSDTKELVNIVQDKKSLPANAELHKYILQTRILIIRQKKTLAKMENDYKQACNRQWLLKKEEISRNNSNINKQGLKKTTDRTTVQLRKNGATAQALLQLKIDINSFGLQKALHLAEQLKGH